MIGFDRILFPGVEITFVRLVIFGTVFIRIVGQFVVVPNADKGFFLMGCLQLRVAAVLFIAGPVIGQGKNFVGGLMHPAQGDYRWIGATLPSPVFVDIVAQMQDNVGFGSGHGPIDVEQTGRIVGTGRDRQFDFVQLRPFG